MTWFQNIETNPSTNQVYWEGDCVHLFTLFRIFLEQWFTFYEQPKHEIDISFNHFLVYLKSVIENFEEGKSLIYWLIIRHEKTNVFHTQLLNSLKLKHKTDRYTTCQICQHFQCCAIYENLRYVVYFCPRQVLQNQSAREWQCTIAVYACDKNMSCWTEELRWWWTCWIFD